MATIQRRLKQGTTYRIARTTVGDGTLTKASGIRKVPASTVTGSATYAADGYAQIEGDSVYDLVDAVAQPTGPAPASLVVGVTANDRRMVAAAVADNGVPTLVDHGKPTYGARRVNLFARNTAAGTATVALYLWSDAALQWFADTVTMSLDAAVDGGRACKVAVDIGRADRVYLRAHSQAGGATVDAWAEALEE